MPAAAMVLPAYGRKTGTFVSGTTGELIEEPGPHPHKQAALQTGIFNTRLRGLPAAIFVFFLVNLTWVFFRAGTFAQAGHLLTSMAGFSHDGHPLLKTLAMVKVGAVVVLLLMTQWLLRNTQLTDVAYRLPWWLTGLIWSLMVVLLILSQESSGSFIYFQF